jgi:oligoendopeptidase F
MPRMSLLPFGSLPAYQPRQFVPAQLDLGDWAQLAPLFDQLESRCAAAQSVADLEAWLLAWGELSAALDEEASRRYIAMSCHTDNADAEKAYLQFVEDIEPQLKPRQFMLEQLFIAHSQRAKLPSPRYDVFIRDVQNHVELFRPENVALETEEAKISQQYQKLSGALTVQFRGEEKTLVAMG